MPWSGIGPEADMDSVVNLEPFDFLGEPNVLARHQGISIIEKRAATPESVPFVHHEPIRRRD
jgi:hypothetical protein